MVCLQKENRSIAGTVNTKKEESVRGSEDVY